MTELSKGQTFADKFRIISELDAGGFSRVYHAFDMVSELHTEVALKIFQLSTNDQRKNRECMALFLREAYCLSKLDHPNIIQILDFGHLNNIYYIVTEFLEGTTLFDIVDKTGPMPEGEVAMIAYEVIKALEFLEHHRVVHRDIKPINIMVNSKGDIKLIDFGLSRHVEEKTVSMKGVFTGTPQFAAPESIRQDLHIDSKADIFSLGASCYYFLTNTEPFPGKNPKEVFKNRLTAKPKSLKNLNSSLSKKFTGLIQKMISFNPEDRPSIAELKPKLSELISKTQP